MMMSVALVGQADECVWGKDDAECGAGGAGV